MTPLGFMTTIVVRPGQEIEAYRDLIVPPAIDPRIVANREIHLRGQEAYMGEAVPELAHGKTRSEQAGCP